MPAIQLARLNRQIAELALLFDQPQRFLRSLHELLEAYHDRTYRAGQIGTPPPISPHYILPLPVVRRVEHEVRRLTQADPQAALALADILWADPYLEPRLLAVLILGQLPLEPPDPVVYRLSTWAQPGEDKIILKTLLTDGPARLLREQPGLWATISRDWLTSTSPLIQAMGLHALQVTASDPSFEDLPAVFRLISPLVQAPPVRLQGDLLALLKVLAERSPGETAYFLRQVVTINPITEVQRLVRRCLPFFNFETQVSLRGAIYQRPTGIL